MNYQKQKIFPLAKTRSKADLNNYYLISLEFSSEIFVMYNRFEFFFDKQFGFLSKHSTIDALAEETEKLRRQENLVFFLISKKRLIP